MKTEELLGVLMAKGLIDESTSKRIQKEAELSRRSAEDVMHEERVVDDTEVAKAKAEALNVPYRSIDTDSISQELLDMIPEATVRSYGLIPMEKKDDLLLVGMMSPDDPKAQEAARFIARKNRVNLGAYVISYGDLQNVLRRYSPYKSEMAAAVQSLNIKPGEAQKIVELEAGAVGEDAPIVRIVAQTLKEAVQIGASDIHIEPQKNYLRIRFRLGGDLEEAESLPAEISQPVVSRVKVISNLRIDETRIPQDGRFRTKVFDREIDFRVSTFPTPLGEKVAIRVLDPAKGLKKMDDLGFVGKNLEIVKRAVERPFGMVLVSGPTGSGKTTALYAILQFLNEESVNIVSLEDPVEYSIQGINQSQVRPEIGYTFASGLRQILRQDPDIIMVGEIRDSETAGLAVHAALTGHIVLSTIHTNNAEGVIPRLVDMGVESFLLPSAVNLMISQRLLPVLCDKCRKEKKTSPAIEKEIQSALEGLPEDLQKKYKAPFRTYQSEGCKECGGKGIVDRIAIHEVLEMTKELSDVVAGGVTTDKIHLEAKRQGMITMRSDGVLKALEGIVSMEAVLRETSE